MGSSGNFTNCIRYFPTQAFNLAFKKMFPKYDPKTQFMQFFGANLVSGGLAAAGSMCIVYPLDYSRTRLASDVGSGKKTFSGLLDCMQKTAAGPGGFMALYTGFGVSVVGIVGYRGLQLGCFDTIVGLNPYKKDKGFMGAVTTFAAAQTAITIGAGATYPFDTVRRRLQMQSEKPVEEHLYKGTMDCFRKIGQIRRGGDRAVQSREACGVRGCNAMVRGKEFAGCTYDHDRGRAELHRRLPRVFRTWGAPCVAADLRE